MKFLFFAIVYVVKVWLLSLAYCHIATVFSLPSLSFWRFFGLVSFVLMLKICLFSDYADIVAYQKLNNMAIVANVITTLMMAGLYLLVKMSV